MMKHLREVAGTIVFVVFVCGKVTSILAAWSWWWMLFPLVPVLAWVLGIQ